MAYRSNLPDVRRRLRAARWAALIAAAEVLLEKLKSRHRGGYTSGDFVTGNVLNSLVRSDPENVNGDLQIRVTTTQTDPPYPVFWTLGHVNLFTRKYERVDHWTPALGDAALPARAEYQRVFAERMGG